MKNPSIVNQIETHVLNQRVEDICMDKDNVVEEYSLEEILQAIGNAEYELSNALSKKYQRNLPTMYKYYMFLRQGIQIIMAHFCMINP